MGYKQGNHSNQGYKKLITDSFYGQMEKLNIVELVYGKGVSENLVLGSTSMTLALVQEPSCGSTSETLALVGESTSGTLAPVARNLR